MKEQWTLWIPAPECAATRSVLSTKTVKIDRAVKATDRRSSGDGTYFEGEGKRIGWVRGKKWINFKNMTKLNFG